MTIDTHLHVWSDNESRYPFGEVSQPASGDRASVELLNEYMAAAGVTKASSSSPSTISTTTAMSANL